MAEGLNTMLETVPESTGTFLTDFVKYSIPGVMTVEEANAGAAKLQRAYEYAKQQDYRRAAGHTLEAIGHAFLGALGLVPFAGNLTRGVKVMGVTTSEPKNAFAKSVFTKEGTPAKQTFSANELRNQAQVRLDRTLNDAEYLEALERAFPGESNRLAREQRIEARKAIISPNRPDGEALLQTKTKVVTTPKLGTHSFTETIGLIQSLIDKAGLKTTPQEYLKQLGLSDAEWNYLVKYQPEIRLSDEAIEAFAKQNQLNQDELRKLIYHELVHAGGSASEGITNLITTHNQQFLPKVHAGVPLELEKASEVRARAMSLRRLRQTTNKSYKELLETWNTTKHRPDPNIDDLVNLYDRESLLNYLDHFLKEGGKINYLENF